MLTRTNEKLAASMDLELQEALFDALAAGDDSGLFRVVARETDEAAAYQFLCQEAPRLRSRVRGRPTFSELLFIPVIERSHGATIGNQRAWRAAEHCVSDALDEWLPRGVRKTVFRGIRPYEWVAAWGPSMVRKHLLAAIPGGVPGKCSFSVEEISLPSDAPRLGFIIVAAISQTGWAQLSIADPLRNDRFQSVVAHALNGVAAKTPPFVLGPDHMSLAIAEGICLWVSELHQTAPVRGWSLIPAAGDSDRVQISIRFERGSLQLGVRRYQIGPAGVDQLARSLWKYGCEVPSSPMQ